VYRFIGKANWRKKLRKQNLFAKKLKQLKNKIRPVSQS